jgi:hypothetical protein
MDGDGDLDVLGSQEFIHRIAWYAQNQVPVFTSPVDDEIAENTAFVQLLTAEDGDFAPSLTFSIAGSTADNNLFEITNGNELRFKVAPDFENPTDIGGVAGDNVYEVTVQVDDGNAGVASQTVLVTVTDVELDKLVGTDGDDDISLTFTDSEIQIVVNGDSSTYAYESDLSSGIIEIDGLGGNDTIQVNLGDVDDSVVNRLGLTKIINSQLETNIFNIETVELFAGGGIDDILFLDSPGDDTFRRDATFAEMTGDGFTFSGSDFESVGAFANQGGEDLAIINATNSDDIFLSKNGIGTLLGTGFTFNATDFENMEAYGIAGGTNRAILQGSAGADQFFRSPEGATLVVDGKQALAQDFAIVTAMGNGGDDSANLHDSVGDDFFFTQPGNAYLLVDDAPYANAIGFPRISLRSLLGNDEVFMTAPGDNNVFSADVDSANLISGEQYVLSSGFNTATARVLPGTTNQATLRDSAADDKFVMTPNFASTTVGDSIAKAVNFSDAKSVSTQGSDNLFLNDSSGDDELYITEDLAVLTTSSAKLTGTGFRSVYATAMGGIDNVNMVGTALDETYVARPGFGLLSRTGLTLLAEGFDNYSASSGGGTDFARLIGSAGAETLFMNSTSTTLKNDSMRLFASGFRSIEANGNGGDDLAYVTDTADDDFLNGDGASVWMFNDDYFKRITDFDKVFARAVSGGINRNQLSTSLSFDLETIGDWI